MREKLLGDSGRKRVNSKAKGNLNEREVAKALTKWTGVTFRRTPASGAIHVPLDWLCGDVFCTDKNFDFPFSVETKHYHKITDGMKDKWWEQAAQDAARIGAHPMLIYRQDGWPKSTWMVRVSPMFSYYFYKMGIAHKILPLNGKRDGIEVSSKALFHSSYEQLINYMRDGQQNIRTSY
jgi:Holliday junction resolvase